MKHGKRSLAFSFLVVIGLASFGVGAGAARADQPVVPAEAGSASGEPDKPYRSPMQEQCEGELRKDKVWYATLKEQLRADVHQQDANLIARNNKHVIMAYAAIWILTVAFVFFLWTRQSALRAEISRLERDLAAAAGDTGAAGGGGKGGSRK
jgi:CcmD family protein